MIVSFTDSATEDLFHGTNSAKARAFGNIAKVAVRKLDVLNAADTLAELAAVPGNNLEALVGDLVGCHSIRINRQFRIVFRWDNGAHEVRIVDYH